MSDQVNNDNDQSLQDPLLADDLEVRGFNIKSAVFLIPLGTPIPPDVSQDLVVTGTLYERIFPLVGKTINQDFLFVPISGGELAMMDRLWRTMMVYPRVFSLTLLPSVKYDVLYTQAARQIGIPDVDWPAVVDSIAKKVRTDQQLTDKKPWLAGQVESISPRTSKTIIRKGRSNLNQDPESYEATPELESSDKSSSYSDSDKKGKGRSDAPSYDETEDN